MKRYDLPGREQAIEVLKEVLKDIDNSRELKGISKTKRVELLAEMFEKGFKFCYDWIESIEADFTKAECFNQDLSKWDTGHDSDT